MHAKLRRLVKIYLESCEIMIKITVYTESETQDGYNYDEILVNPHLILSINSLPENDDLYQLTLSNGDVCYLTDKIGRDKIVGAFND